MTIFLLRANENDRGNGKKDEPLHSHSPVEFKVMKQSIAVYFGEFLGTFILVFFGTAIVAVSVLFNAPVGLSKLRSFGA